MKYTLKHLEALSIIARLSNFTRAAEELHVTRPALSLTIKELESQLGFEVFQRTTRQVELTDAGRAFLPYAEKVLAEYHNSQWAAKNVSTRSEGILRVAAGQLMASTFLPSVIAEFAGQYPRVDVQIADVPYGEIGNAVAAGKVDIGIAPERQLPPKVSAAFLFSLPIYYLCSERHALASRESVSWQELSEQQLIAIDRFFVLNLMHDTGYSVQLTPAIDVNHLLTGLALVARNVGVMTSMVHVGSLLPGFGIRMIPLVDPEVHRKVVLITHSQAKQSPAAAGFLSLARDLIPKLAAACEPKSVNERGTALLHA